MKLSVIVPVYNVKNWLGETVNSVLDQTLRDLELILVDDGSADGSGELCDGFARSDSRVKVIHQKNAGVSAARNAGLDAAKGEWIGWVDSDDLAEADMFERMLEIGEAHGAQIVQCQHDRALKRNGAARSEETEIMDGAGFVRRMFTKQGGDYTNQVALWSKLYRRELWEDIRFPVGMVYEDEMQTYKVCLKAERIAETKDVLYHYVKRENSIITGETPKKMLQKQAALADRLGFLPGVLPELEKECARSFWGYSLQCKDAMSGAQRKQAVRALWAQRKRLRKWLTQREKLSLLKLRVVG